MEPEATASPGLAGRIEHDLSGYDAVKVGKLWRSPKPALVEYMSGSQAGIA